MIKSAVQCRPDSYLWQTVENKQKFISQINYYDTAWGYHGENSETVMGKALARSPVRTKKPGGRNRQMMSNTRMACDCADWQSADAGFA